jgi:hypothetical protein
MKKLLLLAAFLAGTAQAATFTLFQPATGILKGVSTSYITSAAAAGDVFALWSGTCSSSTFLRGDGACATPAGSGGTVTSVALTVPSFLSISGSPVTSSGTLAVSLSGTALPVANGGTGATTITGPIKGNGTSAFSAAAAADMYGLWSGSCSSSTYLRGDGSCATPSGSGGTITTTGSPATGNLAKFSGSLTLTNGDLSGDCTTSGTLAITCTKTSGLGFVASATTDTTSATNILSGTLAAARLPSNAKVRSFGTTFGDTGGSALTAGSIVYFTVPYTCTISAWNATVDAGTVTFDVWKIATGTAIPTVTNTITASALPAISTGTAIHSTTLTSWTTSVAANDIVGIQLKTVATAKYAELDVECDQ